MNHGDGKKVWWGREDSNLHSQRRVGYGHLSSPMLSTPVWNECSSFIIDW